MAAQDKKSKALREKEGITTPHFFSPKAAQIVQDKRNTSPTAKELVQGILQGNRTSLSQAITIIESTAKKHNAPAEEIIKSCLPHANRSIRIGITGVPGVGKSSFIERFGTLLTTVGKKVAVLTIDPSSSLSKGSILGDKTRMEALVNNPAAYIRPSASGTSLGGVARKTREAMILCEAAGYDILIIETVGVGQSETAVHSMTDFFLLLKLAGAGDELQGIKRGIMEMADAIAINKADGENRKAAKLAKAEFNRALHLYPPKSNGWTPQTRTCSALQNEGITAIWELILEYITTAKSTKYFEQRRHEQNKFWLLQTIENKLKSDFFENATIKEELPYQIELVSEGKKTPFQAAEYLLGLP